MGDLIIELIEKEILISNFVEVEVIPLQFSDTEILNIDINEKEITNIESRTERIEIDLRTVDVIHAEGEIRGQGLFELDENLDMMPIETFTQNFEKDINRDIQPKASIDFSTIIDDEFELDENLDIMPKS